MKKNSGTIKMLVGGIAVALMLSTTAAFAGDAQYERQGRFVKRVVEVEKRAPAAQSTNLASSATYDKGSLGEYSRTGRFVKRKDVGGQRGISKRELASAGVRHEHGLNGKSHRNLSN